LAARGHNRTLLAESMKKSISAWFLPGMRDILFLAIFVSVLLLGFRMLNKDGDLPRHLDMGRFVAQTGTVPTTEPFVYPNIGKPFVASEWLGELILYLTYACAGLAGVVLLSAVVLASTFTLLYADLSSRLKLNIPVLFLIAWGAAVSSLHWNARPHLISMLLLVVCLFLTDRLARGEKVPFWQLPALIALWANVHGEFLVGIVVIFAYAAGWTWDHFFKPAKTLTGSGWKIWLALPLSLLASLINPAGIRPWLTVVGFLGNRYMMSRMAETNAPNFQDPGLYVVLALVAFSIFLLSIKGERISTGRAFLLSGFTIMVLMTIRNVHLYGLVAPFVLAGAFSSIDETRVLNSIEQPLNLVQDQLKGFLWPLLITLGLGFFVLTSPGARQIYRFDPAFFPVDAVSWLEQHPQRGNMFNDLDWGGYINLHLWPEHPAFLDSVADMSGGLTREYETAITVSDGWQDILAKYNVAWVLYPPGSPLVDRLAGDPAWETVYSDPTAVILHKK
jgi:hypothetical protein